MKRGRPVCSIQKITVLRSEHLLKGGVITADILGQVVGSFDGMNFSKI
jgi:hypothetical protein